MISGKTNAGGAAGANESTAGHELTPHRHRRPSLAAPAVLALAGGFGGLLYEVVCLRYATRLLGAGSFATALVVGTFLLGLGLGARELVPRRSLRRFPTRSALFLYLGVVMSMGLAFGLPEIRPGGSVAFVLCFLAVLVPSVFMGAAFPLVIVGVTRVRGGSGIGLLQGLNLLGSVAGAGFGGSWLIPDYGLQFCLLVSMACYWVAALAAWLATGFDLPEPARVRKGAPLRTRLLVAAGAATLLLQVWLPRRLGFFLGSYLSTQTGTLVAVLAGLSLGSFLAETRLAAIAPRTMALLAAVGCALTLIGVELLGPTLSQIELTGPWQSLLVAAGLPTALMLPAAVPLGILFPLVLQRATGPDGLAPRVAGKGFFLFSLGAALASLGVPLLFRLPDPLRLLPVVAALPLALAPRRVLAGLMILGLLAGSALAFRNRPWLLGARHFPAAQLRKTVLAEKCDEITSASVVRERLTRQRLLYTDEFSAAGGTASTYMRALGFLAHDFAPADGDLAVLCLGTGTTAAALARVAGSRRLHVVELSRAVIRLAPQFEDAFAAWSRSPGLLLHRGDGRHFLEGSPKGSLAGVTLEPLLPQAPGSVHLYSRGFYRAALRALVPGGVCVQWVPTHALALSDYRALLETFVAAFGDTRVLLVDNSTLLVGRKPGGAKRDVKLTHDIDSYLCGLWSADDLNVAELGTGESLGLTKSTADPIEDDRPYLERRRHAPGIVERTWLATNLDFLETRVSANADKSPLTEARARRLAAKRALASGGDLGLAVRDFDRARSLFPDSTLLWREWRAARARNHSVAARRALESRRDAEALRSIDLALREGRLTAWRLAARTEALWRVGRKDDSRAAQRLLRTLHGEYERLPELALFGDGALEHLFHGKELTGRDALPESPAGDFVSRVIAGDRRTELELGLRPERSRLRLLTALREGRVLPESVLAHLLASLDPAGVHLLEPWLAARTANVRALARHLDPELPVPAQVQRLVTGDKADQRALLDCLRRRDDHPSLRLLVDLVAAAASDVFKPAWVELMRREPRANSIRPGQSAVERQQALAALRKLLAADQR